MLLPECLLKEHRAVPMSLNSHSVFDMRKLPLIRNSGPFIIFAILILAILFNLIFNPYFYSAYNLLNIIQQSTALMLVSIGQTFVIIAGGFDFSVGGVVSLTTCMVATLMKNDPFSYAWVIALVLSVGAAIGIINGIGTAIFRINPFIMTIGTMSAAQGVSYLFREYPGGHVPQPYIKMVTGDVLSVPSPILIIIMATVLSAFILRKTRFGRYIYAIGGSLESAQASGINTKMMQISAFVVSGLFASLGGLFMAARIASGDPRIGESFPLDSITAVVLGGVIIGGGRGSLFGVVGGVFLIAILGNSLTLFDVSPYYHYIVKGILLAFAVAVTFRKEQRAHE